MGIKSSLLDVALREIRDGFDPRFDPPEEGGRQDRESYHREDAQ